MGRPTQHNPPGRQGRGRVKTIRVRYAIPEPHTPLSSGRGGGVAARDRVAAVIAAGTRPDLSFPNPEAKTASADGTAPARVWESRTPPPTPTTKKGGPPSGPPFFLVCPRTHAAPAARRPTPPPARRHRPADNHHTARRRHRRPPTLRPPAGVLSVTPAINTARQTTNTPTTGMLVESDLLL